jgi:hypothetical protein
MPKGMGGFYLWEWTSPGYVDARIFSM